MHLGLIKASRQAGEVWSGDCLNSTAHQIVAFLDEGHGRGEEKLLCRVPDDNCLPQLLNAGLEGCPMWTQVDQKEGRWAKCFVCGDGCWVRGNSHPQQRLLVHAVDVCCLQDHRSCLSGPCSEQSS